MNLAHLAPGGAGVGPLFGVVASGQSFSVVLANKRGVSVCAPLTLKRLPAHRSDVQVDEIADLAAMGLPGGIYLIRCGRPFRQNSGVVVGQCSVAVRQAIVRALRREADGQAMEHKYSAFRNPPPPPPPPMACGCRQLVAHLAA